MRLQRDPPPRRLWLTNAVLNILRIQAFKEATDCWAQLRVTRRERETHRERNGERKGRKGARGARGEMEKEEDWLLPAMSTLPDTHRDAHYLGPQNF